MSVVCPVFLFVLSVLFVILTFELNFPGNLWLAAFAVLALSLRELNIFVESRLQMSSYPVPVTSTYKFSCQIGQAFTSFLSLANQRSCDQSDFPPQGELSIHSWLLDFKPCHHCGICFFQLPIIAFQLLNWLVFGSPKEFFHLFHSSKSKIEIRQESRTSTFLPRYCGLKYGDQTCEAK